jgi:hypothetical protein
LEESDRNTKWLKEAEVKNYLHEPNDEGNPFSNGGYETPDLLIHSTHSLMMRYGFDKEFWRSCSSLATETVVFLLNTTLLLLVILRQYSLNIRR